MSTGKSGQTGQGRSGQNTKRAAAQRADAPNERFLRAFLTYGWVIMLLVSAILAYLLGAF